VKGDLVFASLMAKGKKDPLAKDKIELDTICPSPCDDKDPYCVTFTHIPPAGHGDPKRVDTISGVIRGANPVRHHALVYSLVGKIWLIQSSKGTAFTAIDRTGRFSADVILADRYGVILVEKRFVPEFSLAELPKRGQRVLWVQTAEGAE